MQVQLPININRARLLYGRDGMLAPWTVIALAMLIAVVLIAILSVVLPYDSVGAALVLDRHRGSIFPYPLTIQNITYLIFAAGLGDLYTRWRAARKEQAFIARGFLPEDDASVLQIADLGPIRRKVAGLYDGNNGFLPYLIDVTTTQLQSSHSVDQSVSIMQSSLDLLTHRVDLRYQSVRYIAWLIPTIGFIGTVVGIAVALEFIDPRKIDIGRVTSGLAVSFYTTLVALLVSAVLVFFQHAVQKMEESALNDAAQYCLKNLINRVYVPRSS
jgi:biopolymer transport protein ExbB/TolQ